MPTIRFPSRRAKRLSLVLAIAGVALGGVSFGIVALCVAASLRTTAHVKPEQPTRPVFSSGSPAAARQQATPQHGPRTVHFDLLAKLLADDRRSDLAGAWRQQLADPQATCRVETQPHPLLGQPAPDFTLRNHLGEPWNLSEQLADGPVVVVFYLGYSCNACVHHLCELNADAPRFRELGARVVAISADPPQLTRRRFDEYGAFGFPVLSDPDHAVARQYGILRPAEGSATGEESEPEQLLHGTFIIDRQGDVDWVNRGDVPFRGNMALLYELARLGDHSPLPEPAEARRP